MGTVTKQRLIRNALGGGGDDNNGARASVYVCIVIYVYNNNVQYTVPDVYCIHIGGRQEENGDERGLRIIINRRNCFTTRPKTRLDGGGESPSTLSSISAQHLWPCAAEEKRDFPTFPKSLRTRRGAEVCARAENVHRVVFFFALDGFRERRRLRVPPGFLWRGRPKTPVRGGGGGGGGECSPVLSTSATVNGIRKRSICIIPCAQRAPDGRVGLFSTCDLRAVVTTLFRLFGFVLCVKEKRNYKNEHGSQACQTKSNKYNNDLCPSSIAVLRPWAHRVWSADYFS